MPRGGNPRPDGFSPHKHSDGRVLKILKSSQSKTGYQNIVKLRGSFWAKKKLDAEPGSKKARFFGKSDTCASGARTQDPPLPHPSLLYPSPSGKSVLPGPRTLLSFPAVCGRVHPPLSPACVFESHCGRARGAGLNLALYEDEPYELPAIVPRKHTEKYDVEKKEKRVEALMAEAAPRRLDVSPLTTNPGVFQHHQMIRACRKTAHLSLLDGRTDGRTDGGTRAGRSTAAGPISARVTLWT